MNKSIFITGTDTDIGKTFISCSLCSIFLNKNLKVGYFKPLQSGAYSQNNKLIAPDIEELKKYYPNINILCSYLLKGETSPYLASILNNIEINIEKIKNDFETFKNQNDITIIEGAGGLFCPATKGKTFADIIKKLNQEIIIVTTPDLGRLNHTLMTIDCAKNKGIEIKGIIINKIPNEKTSSIENFEKELLDFTDIPILAKIPKLTNFDEVGKYLENINL